MASVEGTVFASTHYCLIQFTQYRTKTLSNIEFNLILLVGYSHENSYVNIKFYDRFLTPQKNLIKARISITYGNVD